MFITFEGIDGCGKTTQIKQLHERLQKNGIKSILTREPGGSSIGNTVRSLVLEKREHLLNHQTELLLFLAERFQHIEEIIQKGLDEKKVILCDRFHDATIAYQGGGRKLDLKGIESLERLILQPDLTIWFDITVEEAQKRLVKRAQSTQEQNQFDEFDIEFHQRVREGYLMLYKKFPNRIMRIKASKSIEEIHKEVTNIIQRKSKLKIQ